MIVHVQETTKKIRKVFFTLRKWNKLSRQELRSNTHSVHSTLRHTLNEESRKGSLLNIIFCKSYFLLDWLIPIYNASRSEEVNMRHKEESQRSDKREWISTDFVVHAVRHVVVVGKLTVAIRLSSYFVRTGKIIISFATSTEDEGIIFRVIVIFVDLKQKSGKG